MVRQGAGAQLWSGGILLALAWKKWALLSSIQPLTEQRPAKSWNQRGLKSLLWVGIAHCSQAVSCPDYALTPLLTVWQRNFHGHCNPLMTSLSRANATDPNINPELTFVFMWTICHLLMVGVLAQQSLKGVFLNAAGSSMDPTCFFTWRLLLVIYMTSSIHAPM